MWSVLTIDPSEISHAHSPKIAGQEQIKSSLGLSFCTWATDTTDDMRTYNEQVEGQSLHSSDCEN